MKKTTPLQYLLFAIWIANCILGGIIAIQQIWIPHIGAADIQTSEPFDGAIFPITQIPDWSQERLRDKTLTFQEIAKTDLIAMPQYDIKKLQKPNNNKESLILKYSYPVVYMGNYQLDYEEYVGGHPGIDIRAPIGTPVLSIANGVVVKTIEADATGNKYIVIRHDNVPIDGKESTIFSNYLHLSSIDVTVGTLVNKGTPIGKVGNTGISTAPHLHLQIDTDTAPFHPYWHFSIANTRAQGISFFDAVNTGIKMDTAMMYTLHPMDIINQKTSTKTAKNEKLESLVKYKQDDIVVAGKIIENSHACNTLYLDIPIQNKTMQQLQILQKNGCLFQAINGNFSGNTSLTRKEALIVLMKYHKEKKEKGISSVLDIPLADTELHQFANTAIKKGIINKNYFSPNQPITQGEFVEFISRWNYLPDMSQKKPYYSNVGKNHTFFAAIQRYGYISKDTRSTFDVNSLLTRSQAVDILANIATKFQK